MKDENEIDLKQDLSTEPSEPKDLAPANLDEPTMHNGVDDLLHEDDSEELTDNGGDMNDDSAAHAEDQSASATGPINYSEYTKTDFINLLQGLLTENDFKKSDQIIREAKAAYDENRTKERAAALFRFTQDGGVEEDFEFKGDEDDAAFDAAFKALRDKKNNHFKHIEEQKATNLRHKEELLEKLRALAESEDTEHSLNAFKRLQNEWRAIGPVAPAQSKTLWANYGALVDRFYDQRSIYFELKELDRRKNLTLKQELCDKAEKLVNVERIQQAVRELNELHNEFKHIGPVPKEDKEALWQRFKAASDAIYAKRDAYMTELTGELNKNLEAKNAMGEELASFASFQTDRIKEWNQKTQDILALQKRWDAVGAVPRAKSKDINKKFWSAFKTFFNNKNQFFKKLDEGRDGNLKAKQVIIARANEIKDNTDWEKTSNELKELQNQWKEIGPVQEKFREKIFQEFKAACDHFFEQRRGQFDKADREQEDALHAKEAICTELEQLAETKTGTPAKLNELQNKFNAAGFVPKRSINSIRTRFNEAVNKLVATLDISPAEKNKTLLGIQLGNLKSDPQGENKIYHKEQTIRKRILKIENDIATLRNNLEFFGRSKNADSIKAEFNGQIATATEELKELKNQLKMLKTASA